MPIHWCLAFGVYTCQFLPDISFLAGHRPYTFGVLFNLSNDLNTRAMGMHVTDRDRVATLDMLFSKEESQLPFSRQKLDYLKPLSHRLVQLGLQGKEIDPSLAMLRQMIDELLIEITAQVNWSMGQSRTGHKKRVLTQLGLIQWNQNSTDSSREPAKVA